MPDPSVLARWIFYTGLGLILIAGLVWVLGRMNITLGSLPGDFRLQNGGFSCFIPLASSLLISVILTILLNLILRGLRK